MLPANLALGLAALSPTVLLFAAPWRRRNEKK
jgi:hypothetical protein